MSDDQNVLAPPKATLNGKWPEGTWFQRALLRVRMERAIEESGQTVERRAAITDCQFVIDRAIERERK